MFKKTTLILTTILLAASLPLSAWAQPIDLTHMAGVFDEFDAMEPDRRDLYYEYMKGAMDSDYSLELLAENMDYLLTEEQVAKIEAKGMTVDEVKENIPRLQTWSRDDRLLLVSLFKERDTEGIEALNAQNAGASGGVVQGGTLPALEEALDSPPTGFIAHPPEVLETPPVFADVTGHWARDAIGFLSERGVIKGRGGDRFAPEDPVSRCEVVALILRLVVEEPEAFSPAPLAYEDVSSDSWYGDAVGLAVHLDIARGTGTGRFEPETLVTREQLAVFLIRTLEAMGLEEADPPRSLEAYADGSRVSSWARESFAKALSAGFFGGFEDGTLRPGARATRAQTAVLLKRFYEYIDKRMDWEIEQTTGGIAE